MSIPKLALPKFDSVFLQRLVLAFTTGLFLACAARVSDTQAEPVSYEQER